jgi:hypothetical protein
VSPCSPCPDYTQTDIWQFFQRIDAERQAMGIAPPSQKEVDAYLAALRDEDEERAQELERIQEECRRQREEKRPEAE